MSRNRCAPWAVRQSWSSHHVHRLVRAARGNRSLSVTSMKMLRFGPIGELYHRPTWHDTRRLGANQETVFTVSDPCDPYARVNAEFGSRAQSAGAPNRIFEKQVPFTV